MRRIAFMALGSVTLAASVVFASGCTGTRSGSTAWQPAPRTAYRTAAVAAPVAAPLASASRSDAYALRTVPPPPPPPAWPMRASTHVTVRPAVRAPAPMSYAAPAPIPVRRVAPVHRAAPVRRAAPVEASSPVGFLGLGGCADGT
jgi:hypothetical protein